MVTQDDAGRAFCVTPPGEGPTDDDVYDLDDLFYVLLFTASHLFSNFISIHSKVQ